MTPGPLTTSKSVKQAMVHDWGSRDAAFIALIVGDGAPARDRARRGALCAVPMQGSGTFAVEAMLTTFVPRDGLVLVLVNGAYGQRAKRILDIAGREAIVHETPEDTPPDLSAVERILTRRPRSPMSSLSIARRQAASSIRSTTSPRSSIGTARGF